MDDKITNVGAIKRMLREKIDGKPKIKILPEPQFTAALPLPPDLDYIATEISQTFIIAPDSTE